MITAPTDFYAYPWELDLGDSTVRPASRTASPAPVHDDSHAPLPKDALFRDTADFELRPHSQQPSSAMMSFSGTMHGQPPASVSQEPAGRPDISHAHRDSGYSSQTMHSDTRTSGAKRN
jgi:hypothetical protein